MSSLRCRLGVAIPMHVVWMDGSGNEIKAREVRESDGPGLTCIGVRFVLHLQMFRS